MKRLWALAALALAQLVRGRGLKPPTSRSPDAESVRSKQLEVENAELRKKNEGLEATMQMARAEVLHMDAVAGTARTLKRLKTQQQVSQQGNCGDANVLKQEIQDLKKKLKGTEGDNADLVQTLRRMLQKNSTKIFQKQAERAQEMKMALEMRCAQDRQTLEAQIKDMNGKCDDSKEQAKDLQDENADLRQKLHDLRAEFDKVSVANKDLTSNKAYLVSTMQALIRENNQFKEGLKKESDLEKKEAKELEVDKATLAKMSRSKKTPKEPLVKKQQESQKKGSKALLGHREKELNTAADHAHIREMNKYIDGAEAPPLEDVEQVKVLQEEDLFEKGQVKALQKQEERLTKEQVQGVEKEEDLLEKGKVGAHLSDWLGLKIQQPEKKVDVHAATSEESEAFDADSEAASLLRDAKAQLAAMDSIDA